MKKRKYLLKLNTLKMGGKIKLAVTLTKGLTNEAISLLLNIY